jgi:ribosomal protein L37AE/L43A
MKRFRDTLPKIYKKDNHPICPHCKKQINKARLSADVCMCEWKGVKKP